MGGAGLRLRTGCAGVRHGITKVGERGGLAGPSADASSEGPHSRCPHTHLPPPPGIDKLTEKSQVSEDGTLRSLEPTSQQSSADGSPTAEVGDGDSHSGVRLGLPFLPSLCGGGRARVLWDYLQQRAETQCPGHLGTGGAFTDLSLVYWSQA